MTMLQVNESDSKPPKLRALKDLTPLAHDKMLKALAQEINSLIQEHDDRVEEVGRLRLRVGEKLWSARDIFYKQAGLAGASSGYARNDSDRSVAANNFYDWCDKFIRNRKGQPYIRQTIKGYISFYKNPEARQNAMEAIRARLAQLNERNAPAMTVLRGSATHKQRARALVKLFKDTPKEVQFQVLPKLIMQSADHVNILVSAWDKAPSEARQQFLSIAGLKHA